MSAPALSIDITGKTDKWEKSLDKVGSQADKAVADIESKFSGFDPQLNLENYTKSLTSMVAGFGVAGVGAAAVIGLVVTLNKSLSDTADLADRVGLSTGRLQQLKFGANALGVGDDDFNKSLDTFATNLQNAKFQANDLTRVFDANKVSIKDGNGQIKDTNTLLASAFDIIKRAPTLQDALQIGSFLGFSRDYAQSIHSAGDEYLRLAAQANAAGAVIDDATIKKARQFSDEWGKAAALWSTTMKASIGGILPLLNDAVNGVVAIINAVKSTYSFLSAIKDFAIAPNLDTASVNQLRSLLAQYEDIKKTLDSGQLLNPIQLFQGSNIQVDGKITAASAQAAIDDIKSRIEKANKTLPRVVITSNPSTNPGPKQTDTKDTFDNEVDRLAKRTATINADTAATFQNNSAQASFRAEFQLLTAVMRDGGEVTQAQIDVYEKLRQSMSAEQALTAAGINLTKEHSAAFLSSSSNIGIATTKFDAARLSLNQLNSASQQLGSALSTAFGDAVVDGKNLNDVVTGLEKTLEKAAINSLFSQVFNAPASGGLSPFLNFLGIGKNAEGTDNWSGGPTWVGEKGPEILNLPRGAQVIPNSVASRAGSGGATNNINVAVTGATGNAEIQGMVMAGMAAAYRKAVAAAPGATIQHQARYA